MSSLFVFDGLRITRRDGSLWVEGGDEPLNPENARIRFCCLENEDGGGRAIAFGTREQLEGMDSPLKVVTVGPVVPQYEVREMRRWVR